jgi:hypothetical protein
MRRQLVRVLLAGGSGKPAGFRGVAQARVMHSFRELTMPDPLNVPSSTHILPQCCLLG